MIRQLTRAFKWALGEITEKLDVPGTIRDLKEAGKRHGRRFLIFAVVWEIIEDVIFPALSIYYGMPELVAFFLIFHFEPLTYPTALWAFRVWDRVRGVEPWDPARLNTSTYFRTTIKTAIYWLITLTVITGLTRAADVSVSDTASTTLLVMLGAFGFVHERIWNDQNQWIDVETDEVHPNRNVAKAATYTLITTLLLTSFYNAAGAIPWLPLAVAHATLFGFYWLCEWAWSGVEWGLRPSSRSTPESGGR